MNSHRRNIWSAAAMIAALMLVASANPSEARLVRGVNHQIDAGAETGSAAVRQQLVDAGDSLRRVGSMLLIQLRQIAADDWGALGPARHVTVWD
jgi:hypothetical protein